jgi:hypothetical protein
MILSNGINTVRVLGGSVLPAADQEKAYSDALYEHKEIFLSSTSYNQEDKLHQRHCAGNQVHGLQILKTYSVTVLGTIYV